MARERADFVVLRVVAGLPLCVSVRVEREDRPDALVLVLDFGGCVHKLLNRLKLLREQRPLIVLVEGVERARSRLGLFAFFLFWNFWSLRDHLFARKEVFVQPLVDLALSERF